VCLHILKHIFDSDRKYVKYLLNSDKFYLKCSLKKIEMSNKFFYTDLNEYVNMTINLLNNLNILLRILERNF